MDTIKKQVSIQLTRDKLILSPLKKTPKYCLIFLHGLGMCIQKFFSVFLNENLVGLLDDFKIVIPQAPIRVTQEYQDLVEIGDEGFSWYHRNAKSFREATESIKALVQKELEAVDNDPRRLFLAGFSQGSILALCTGLNLDFKVGGIVVIGGMMRFTTVPEVEDISDVLIIHGGKDAINPWPQTQESMKTLFEKPNVNKVVIEDMEHDLYSDVAKKVFHDFVRERVKNL